jgi:uncharacterized repeat protein (TIGR03837 family)
VRSDFAALRCDIFCAVVDNYGDIGVCWRLARQLANEYGVAVRLWVDDLASFCKLCPEVDVQLEQQHCRNVEVRHWAALFPEIEPTNLVIEAFACKLPESYVAAMAAQKHKPVWVNLEYLSAEDWVEGCHKLPSPHPSLPLVKYFFFPGFTPRTGGLLLEHDLLVRRDAFQRDPQAIAAYWESFGIPTPQTNETRVSLFSYENTALPKLLTAWAEGGASTRCLVPEGRALPQLATFFGKAQAMSSDVFRRGNLEVRVLPFVEQERYDQLLWACDINFVRGEDSCVRAQWAGKPFVWQIYPQHDGVHLQKLRAFIKTYCARLPADTAQALHGLWEAWNPSAGSGYASSTSSGQAWNNFWKHRPILQQHAHDWAQELSVNNLASNLLDFFSSIDRMCDC